MKKYSKEKSMENMSVVKKYIVKIVKEFKAFINKGSVLDLAVGLMIGSAFTAIVSSLVNNILKPLINWIPGIDGTGALQTVLRNAVTDADGNVITEALIIDWGAVISAIITFFLTALITFVLIKLIAKIKEAGLKLKDTAMDAAEKAIDERRKKEQENGDKASEKKVLDAISQFIAMPEEPTTAEETTPKTQDNAQGSNENIEALLKRIVELLEEKKENKQ